MIQIDKTGVRKCPYCKSKDGVWLTQETVEELLYIDFYECHNCHTIYGKPFRATQPCGLHYQEICIKTP